MRRSPRTIAASFKEQRSEPKIDQNSGRSAADFEYCKPGQPGIKTTVRLGK